MKVCKGHEAVKAESGAGLQSKVEDFLSSKSEKTRLQFTKFIDKILFPILYLKKTP